MLVLSGAIVGGLAFLNTWDLPTFGFLIALLTGLYLCGGAAIQLNANAFAPIGAVLSTMFPYEDPEEGLCGTGVAF